MNDDTPQYIRECYDKIYNVTGLADRPLKLEFQKFRIKPLIVSIVDVEHDVHQRSLTVL